LILPIAFQNHAPMPFSTGRLICHCIVPVSNKFRHVSVSNWLSGSLSRRGFTYGLGFQKSN
jgi:hypothetical protein